LRWLPIGTILIGILLFQFWKTRSTYSLSLKMAHATNETRQPSFVGFLIRNVRQSTRTTRQFIMSTPTTGRNLAIAGTVCQLGPIIGWAGSVLGMMGAFDTLAKPARPGDPVRLSESINHVLISAAVGLIVGVIGLILLTVSVTACRYRAEWCFWFLVVYGVLALSTYPVGTAFGVFFLGYCLANRQEFLRPATTTLQAPPQS
jgi:hypothetical protein